MKYLTNFINFIVIALSFVASTRFVITEFRFIFLSAWLALSSSPTRSLSEHTVPTPPRTNYHCHSNQHHLIGQRQHYPKMILNYVFSRSVLRSLFSRSCCSLRASISVELLIIVLRNVRHVVENFQ